MTDKTTADRSLMRTDPASFDFDKWNQCMTEVLSGCPDLLLTEADRQGEPELRARIAEYLYGVPWSFKDYMGREKGLLREAVKDLLPEQVLYRKKSPYPKTHHPQYAALVSNRLESFLKQRDAALFALVSKDALLDLLEHPSTCPWYGQLMTGPQTMAYFLQIQFWLEHYDIEIL